jgi:hypothetical protein
MGKRPAYSQRYNSRMRAVISIGGSYPCAGTGYADPDAVTQIANGLSTTTFRYDNNGNVTQMARPQHMFTIMQIA